METCCGTCRWHRRTNGNEEYSCCNEDSEAYGLDTSYDDCCDEQEER